MVNARNVILLFEAVKSRTFNNVKLIPQVDLREIVNVRDSIDQTPLFHACGFEANFEMVKYLIDNGAEINTQNILGSTPMHNAVFYNCPQILRLLLKEGGDPQIQDKNGRNVFYYAKIKEIL